MPGISHIENNIYRLSDGEKVNSIELEKQIEGVCHYVQYATVAGEYEEHLVAIIFANKKLLSQPNYERSLEDGCFCPRTLAELSRCLTGCLKTVNNTTERSLGKTIFAAVVGSELSIDSKSLGTSIKMKVSKDNVIEKYRGYLLNKYGRNIPENEEIYLIRLESGNERSKKIKAPIKVE